MNHTACDWSSVCLRPRANVVCPKMASEIVRYIWWAIPVGVLCLWPPCVPHYSSVLPMGGGGWQMQIIWAMNAWSCYKYLWRSPIYWLCPCLAGPIIPHLGGEKVVVTIRKRARYATLKLKKKKLTFWKVDILGGTRWMEGDECKATWTVLIVPWTCLSAYTATSHGGDKNKPFVNLV